MIISQIEIEAKTDIVGQVSHELKTQVNGIVTYITYLEKAIKEKDWTKICFYSNKIKVINQFQKFLILAFLDMQKMKLLQFNMIKSPFDPKESIQFVMDLFHDIT